jgi:glycosyltransferase involved in cell wall biosynthesis
MILHQFVHTLAYGDAISGEALTIRRLLIEQGIETEIYAVNTDPRYKNLTLSNRDFPADFNGAVLLHYSIASPLNDLFLTLNNAKRAVLYHNLTPEQWFFPYNQRVVADLRQARSGLEAVVRSADLVLGDSAYNLIELEAFLKQPGKVLPLPFDSKKWDIEANPGILEVLNSHGKSNGGVNILSVGRTAPNKCLEDIIKCFYFYHHKINRESRLWLVGSDTDTEIYSFELRDLIDQLQLRDAVTMVGAVADTELKAFYKGADLYLCMSEHEGFCVPLIEAMNFKLPIIAYDSCAVASTLGTAGLVVAKKAHAEIAELMNLVLTRNDVKASLAQAAERELSRFSLEQFSAHLRSELLTPLLGA